MFCEPWEMEQNNLVLLKDIVLIDVKVGKQQPVK